MTLLCSCGSDFKAHFVRDELQILCPRCSKFFERGVQDMAGCWMDWEPRTNALRVLNG